MRIAVVAPSCALKPEAAERVVAVGDAPVRMVRAGAGVRWTVDGALSDHPGVESAATYYADAGAGLARRQGQAGRGLAPVEPVARIAVLEHRFAVGIVHDTLIAEDEHFDAGEFRIRTTSQAGMCGESALGTVPPEVRRSMSRHDVHRRRHPVVVPQGGERAAVGLEAGGLQLVGR